MQQLTGEGAKAYHPACYEKAEREAAEQFELASQPAKAWQRSTVEGGEV